MAGPPDCPQCTQNLSTALLVCDRLGLPLHPGKCVGPTPVLAFLGIELDSLAQVARLPDEKLQALKELIHSWLPRKWCFRRELESLIGHLHHAAKVVWPGRTFLRHMIDLLSSFRQKDHPIWLNKEFHLDLQWWDHLLAQWHGISFWLYPGLSPTVDLEVASDAAGSLGFGAYFQELPKQPPPRSLHVLGSVHAGVLWFPPRCEFTVPNLASFSSSIHLTVQDIAVDGASSPSCMCVIIKVSKTDPFRKGADLHIGLGSHPLCAVQAMMAYLSVRGSAPGPLFMLQHGHPLSRVLLTDWLR